MTDKMLIPTVIQHGRTGKILMVAYSNAEAIESSRQSGYVHFYSRSRNRLWKKGETSGHVLKIENTYWDCDCDSLLYLVEPIGPTCHTGADSCFEAPSPQTSPQTPPLPAPVDFPQSFGLLEKLETHLDRRLRAHKDTTNSYTHRLITGSKGYIIRKLVEESAEVAEAFTENQDNLEDEVADLLYHLMVLMKRADLPLLKVTAKLMKRGLPMV